MTSIVSAGVSRMNWPRSTLSNSPQLVHWISRPLTPWSGLLQTGHSASTILRRSHQKKPKNPTIGVTTNNPTITRADFTNQPSPRLPSNRQTATIVTQDWSRGRLTWNRLGLLLFTQSSSIELEAAPAWLEDGSIPYSIRNNWLSVSIVPNMWKSPPHNFQELRWGLSPKCRICLQHNQH